MKQPKKIFTRMLINNWGGISHKMLEFHEYVIFSAERADRGNRRLWMRYRLFCMGVCLLIF